MKKMLPMAVTVLACVLTFLAAEGAYSLVRWKKPSRSVAYQTYRLLGLAAPSDSQPELNLASSDQFEALIPDMIEAGVGLGNVPFKKVMKVKAAITQRTPEGCVFSKPGLKKEMTQLRSTDFELYDPPVVFYDKEANRSEALRTFVEKYGIRPVSFSTNSQGERLTVPSINARDIVLVAGDSVAAGIAVSDEETLSSRLQQREAARRYINLGVGRIPADDILCNLTAAAKRYPGQIKELIYVYCENDFSPIDPFGRPEDVISWLLSYAKREGIAKVTIVRAPYIFTVLPHLTRFKGYRGEDRPTRYAETERLRISSSKAGFRYIDIEELVKREIRDRGTDFAAFSLFVDLVHLSPYGTEKLADELLGTSSPGLSEKGA